MSASTDRIRANGYANVGIVGTGAISQIYFQTAASSPLLRLKSCSARSVESATPTAEQFGARPVLLEDLLADPEIDLVVNLTSIPQHHAINMAALRAGKHVYSEKPLAATFAEATELMALAAQQQLRVGCAPDTLLGGGHQAARAALDAGRIGTPIAATAFLGVRGIESYVTDPVGYFATDGPLFDIGPYYVSQIIAMLGPVESVVASGLIASPTLPVQSGPKAGLVVEVRVPTTISAVLSLDSGCQATMTLSVDVWQHSHPPLEIYGTEGVLALTDPNMFGGEPRIAIGREPWENLDVAAWPLSAVNYESPYGNFANYRGAGFVEMVHAITEDRPHRASGEIARHVLDVLESISVALTTGSRVSVRTICQRPEPVQHESWNQQ